MNLTDQLYQIADEMRGVALLGLKYEKDDPYALDRYQKILSTSARLIATIENKSPDDILQTFQDNFTQVSPRAGAAGVLVKENKILLIKRSDDGLWAIPGGLVEVGETLAQAAEREFEEETTVKVKAVQLLGIFDSRIWRSQIKGQLYHAIFLMEATNPQPAPTNEATQVDFFPENALPPLSPGHDARVPHLFKILRRKAPCPHFDQESYQNTQNT